MIKFTRPPSIAKVEFRLLNQPFKLLFKLSYLFIENSKFKNLCFRLNLRYFDFALNARIPIIMAIAKPTAKAKISAGEIKREGFCAPEYT